MPVLNIDDDDPRILSAVEEARCRWPEFVAAFAAQRPGDEQFAVKAGLKQNGHTEYMWITVRKVTDDCVTGLLGNDPVNLPSLKIGDSVNVAIDEITDWLYIRRGEMMGGFSIKAIQEIMQNSHA